MYDLQVVSSGVQPASTCINAFTLSSHVNNFSLFHRPFMRRVRRASSGTVPDKSAIYSATLRGPHKRPLSGAGASGRIPSALIF